MQESSPPILWAPRVSREKILQLYIKVASGTNAKELIDDVANSFYQRCSDIVRILEKRFACPWCREELPYPHQPGNNLYCDNCGWRMPWQKFFRSYQGKQLSVNADVTTIIRQFLNDLPQCMSPQDKMILIDSLIHACHEWVRKGTTYYGRPLAVNFIEGTMKQVVAFLENLPYGPASLPEMNEQLIEWRKRCLSLFTDVEVERDKVNYLLESMPAELRNTIVEMIRNKKQQQAITHLEGMTLYGEGMTYHRGTIARRIVRLLQREMKV